MATLFTQKHYKKIAEVLREGINRCIPECRCDSVCHCDIGNMEKIYDKFVKMLSVDNPKFNESKFCSAVWE